MSCSRQDLSIYLYYFRSHEGDRQKVPSSVDFDEDTAAPWWVAYISPRDSGQQRKTTRERLTEKWLLNVTPVGYKSCLFSGMFVFSCDHRPMQPVFFTRPRPSLLIYAVSLPCCPIVPVVGHCLWAKLHSAVPTDPTIRKCYNPALNEP